MRGIVRCIGFLGDYFLILLYSLVAWGLFATGTPFELYAQDLIDVENVAFAVPVGVFVGYVLATFVLYALFYRQVTTYTRWMYAVRVFTLLLLPVATVAVAIKLAFAGQLHLFVNGAIESAVMITGVLLMMFLGWVFASLSYSFVRVVSVKGSRATAPSTLIFPRQMYAILFRRASDGVAAAERPKHSYFRRIGVLKRYFGAL